MDAAAIRDHLCCARRSGPRRGDIGQWEWRPPIHSYISELAIAGVNHAAIEDG
jgi:hypothetical protein